MSRIKDLRKQEKPRRGRKGAAIALTVIVILVIVVLFIFGKGLIFGLRGQTTDRVNILVLGKGGETHAAGDLTDTIMLMSVKPSSDEVAMLSIPRDLQVENNEGSTQKINSVYKGEADQGNHEKGIKLIEDKVSEITGQKIHYYLMIDFVGFKDIVDTLGGVDVNIEEGFYDYFHKTTFNQGVEHMDGERALLYSRVRFIEGGLGTDFARADRQQNLLMSIKDDALSSGTLSSPTKLNELMRISREYIQTNLSLSEMARLWTLIKDTGEDDIIKQVYSTSDVLQSSTDTNGSYILTTTTGDYSETEEIAKDIFKEKEEE